MSDSSNAIEFADVTFRVTESRALLSGVNFSVRRGETLMLLGRSGSGKTTCLKMINRLYAPTAGEVSVDGIPVSQWDVIKLRRRIGYAIQDVGFVPALLGAGERGAGSQARTVGAGAESTPAWRRCWRWWGCRRRNSRSAIRINSPAGSGNVWGWRARWRRNRPSS